MRIIRVCAFIAIVILSLANSSCSKSISGCYDEQLYQQHKNDICTADCPGVIGCDGKFYCNECDALRHGIRLK
jgi:hypothetical protein